MYRGSVSCRWRRLVCRVVVTRFRLTACFVFSHLTAETTLCGTIQVVYSRQPEFVPSAIDDTKAWFWCIADWILRVSHFHIWLQEPFKVKLGTFNQEVLLLVYFVLEFCPDLFHALSSGSEYVVRVKVDILVTFSATMLVSTKAGVRIHWL